MIRRPILLELPGILWSETTGLLAATLESFIMNYPATRGGNFLRRKYFSARAKRAGRALLIGMGCKIEGYEMITMGDHSGLGFGCVISLGPGDKQLIIGDHCQIGPQCYFRNMNHRFEDLGTPIMYQGHQGDDIVIGNDVWIGARVVLLAGAKIGDHSVIAAGSIVAGEIPPFSVAAGSPARVIRTRQTQRG